MIKLCPTCHQDLDEVERWGVRLDICPRCQGVWIKAGKLEQIIESVHISLATTTPHGVVPNGMCPRRAHNDDDERRVA